MGLSQGAGNVQGGLWSSRLSPHRAAHHSTAWPELLCSRGPAPGPMHLSSPCAPCWLTHTAKPSVGTEGTAQGHSLWSPAWQAAAGLGVGAGKGFDRTVLLRAQHGVWPALDVCPGHRDWHDETASERLWGEGVCSDSENLRERLEEHQSG